MAYLRPIVSRCENGGCPRKAVVELLNRVNTIMGRYCRPCGQAALKRLLRDEQLG